MKRIQRRRITGWRKPPNTAYVGRGTPYGNPYEIFPARSGHYRGKWHIGGSLAIAGQWGGYYFDHKWQAQQFAVDLYRVHARAKLVADGPDAKQWRRDLQALVDYDNLMCWCREGDPCHGDVLIELLHEMFPGLGAEAQYRLRCRNCHRPYGAPLSRVENMNLTWRIFPSPAMERWQFLDPRMFAGGRIFVTCPDCLEREDE